MDTLTHALSGALLARATAPEPADESALPLGRRVFLGFVAAALPDLDWVTRYFGSVTFLLHHRGVTHSLLMLPFWALALAWICSLIYRRDRSWRAYFGVFALGIGIHIAGDWITSFGTMVFSPLSDMRVGIGTTFIIDLWFTGIIAAGLIAALIWRRSRIPALAGLGVLCGYVAYQGVLQHRAVEWGEAPEDPAHEEVGEQHHQADESGQQHRQSDVEVAHVRHLVRHHGLQLVAAELLAQEADNKVYNIIHLIYRARIYEGASKDYEFSRRTMEEHWAAGHSDMARTLRHPEVLQRPRSPDGVFTFDLREQSRE